MNEHPVQRVLSAVSITFLVIGLSDPVRALEGQFQLAPYFDSNVQESLTFPEPTYGLKLRGRLQEGFTGSRWSAKGGLLAQTYLDARFQYESKLIASTELDLLYRWSNALQMRSAFSHFQKLFYQGSRSYLWTEFHPELYINVHPQVHLRLGYLRRNSTFTTQDTVRFQRDNLEIIGRYSPTLGTYLESSLRRSEIAYQDYRALSVVDDTVLTALDDFQRDHSLESLLHLRIQRRLIGGIQVAYQSMKSNSVIGVFDQIRVQFYLSGRWGQKTFYHLVLQRVEKNYQSPKLSGISGYRDPEEQIQNRSHLRLERLLDNEGTGYFQVSFLENETIYNRRYYDKILVEMGIMFEL